MYWLYDAVSNKICDQGLSFLVKLKNLKRLNLEDCGIHDYGVAILSNIGTLECLNICKQTVM